MKKLLLLAPFLLPAVPAEAADRCTTYRVPYRIAHGVFLQQIVLRCVSEAEAPSPIDRARDWLSLCEQAGATAPTCAEAYLDLAEPIAGDALAVARAERRARLEPIPAPVAVEPGAPARWKTPRLLTNR